MVKAPPEHLVGKRAAELSGEEMEQMLESMEEGLDEQDSSDLADYLVWETWLHFW
jgi:hypothetical protein